VSLALAVVRHLKNLYSLSSERSPGALVFSKSQRLPLAAVNLEKKAVRIAWKRNGLQRIDWHTLRGTHGTLLHSQKTPLKIAQAQLGHSHMATTWEIYTHASESAQRDAANPLEERLFPNRRFVEIRCRENLNCVSELVVGAPGFEPGASCAQGRRATRLRYAPT